MAPRRRSVVPTIDLKVTRPSIDSLQPNWMGDGRLNKDRFAQLSIFLLFELGSGVHTHRERAPRRWWRRLLTVIGRQNLFARLLLLFRYRYLFSLSSFFGFLIWNSLLWTERFLHFFSERLKMWTSSIIWPRVGHTHTHTHTQRRQLEGLWCWCFHYYYYLTLFDIIFFLNFRWYSDNSFLQGCHGNADGRPYIDREVTVSAMQQRKIDARYINVSFDVSASLYFT